MSDPYNATVRSLFADLRHAGDLQSDYNVTLRASAGREAPGVGIVLVAGVSGGELRQLKFRAYACPHLIAACEYVCRRYNGKPLSMLARFSQQEVMETLAVPVEKTGRILLLEDAIGSLLIQATARQN